MTAPIDRMSIKVTPEVHRLVHDLATELQCTANDAIAHLAGSSTVRVPVTEVEYERWKAAADSRGLRVDEWVKLRVEAALMIDMDPGMLSRNLQSLNANMNVIARHMGLMPSGGQRSAPGGRPSTGAPPPSTFREPTE